ncbi:MAG: HNH endonuclease [Nanoarchaeota archaeon]
MTKITKKEKLAKQIAKRKEKRLNSPKRLKTELDRVFSLYIRQRDKVCRRCGINQNLQCSHIMSRVSQNLRWDERNAMALCYKCHLTWWHKEPLEAAEWCKTIIGEEAYKSLLKEKYEIKQWAIQELRDLILKYDKRIYR